MKLLFIILLALSPAALAGSITPRFTRGENQQTSRTVQKITETIVTQNFRSGYSYQVQGHGIKAKNDVSVSPDAKFSDVSTINNVSFSWISPNLENKPEWILTNPESGESFSLTESILGPGLDAQSHVTREINTEINSTTISIFQ